MSNPIRRIGHLFASRQVGGGDKYIAEGDCIAFFFTVLVTNRIEELSLSCHKKVNSRGDLIFNSGLWISPPPPEFTH